MRRCWVLAVLALTACRGAPDDARGWFLVASDETGNALTVIDGTSEAVLRTVPVGQRPRGVQPVPGGGAVWVALSGSPIGGPNVDESKLPPADKAQDALALVELPSGRIARRVRGVSDPEQLAVGAGGQLYVASEDNGTADFFDAASGQRTRQVPVGGEPEGIALSPDGKVLLVASEADHRVILLDPESGARFGQVTVGARPRGIAFSRDGRRAWVTCEVAGSIAEIDLTRRSLIREVPLGRAGWLPMGVAVSPDGAKLYVAMGRAGMLAELDARTLLPLREVRVGARPWGVALAPDGRTVFTANGPSGDVSAVDTATMRVRRRIRVGERPWGIAVVGP